MMTHRSRWAGNKWQLVSPAARQTDLPVTWSDTSSRLIICLVCENQRGLNLIGGGGASLRVSEMSRVLILMARFFRSESSSRTRTCPSKWNPKSLEIAWSCWIAKWLVIVLETCKYASMQVCKHASMQVLKFARAHVCKYAVWEYTSMQ